MTIESGEVNETAGSVQGGQGDWTGGAAKWAAVIVLGCASIVGMAWSILAWERRDDAREINAERRIDLNTASVSELQLLPDVGPTLAERIVADRDRLGPFETLDDLDRVEGVGPRTIAGLRPFVVIGLESPTPEARPDGGG